MCILRYSTANFLLPLLPLCVCTGKARDTREPPEERTCAYCPALFTLYSAQHIARALRPLTRIITPVLCLLYSHKDLCQRKKQRPRPRELATARGKKKRRKKTVRNAFTIEEYFSEDLLQNSGQKETQEEKKLRFTSTRTSKTKIHEAEIILYKYTYFTLAQILTLQKFFTNLYYILPPFAFSLFSILSLQQLLLFLITTVVKCISS